MPLGGWIVCCQAGQQEAPAAAAFAAAAVASPLRIIALPCLLPAAFIYVLLLPSVHSFIYWAHSLAGRDADPTTRGGAVYVRLECKWAQISRRRAGRGFS
jgi:hypothetical protein